VVSPLAKFLSAAALAATTVFTMQHTTQPVAAAPSDAAHYIGTSDAASPIRTQKRASRSFRTFTIASAPKGVMMRGYWLKAVLHEAGFEGKALREAWAIAMRESTGRPMAYNGNRHTGDKSYGIFQINMIGGLGVDRRSRYDLATNAELFDPLTNARIAYRMSAHGTDWASWKPYNGGSKERGFRKWLKKYPA
jgi:hypothetical protein